MYLSFIRFSRYSRSLPKKAMDSIYFSTEVSCPVGFTGGSLVKNTSANAEDTDLIPGSGRPQEKEMATQSSILVWKIPWTEESIGLQNMGLQRVKWHDLVTKQYQKCVLSQLSYYLKPMVIHEDFTHGHHQKSTPKSDW